MDEERKVAVITGASSGIGEAIAGKLAQVGFRLALIARRGDRLDGIAERICMNGGEAISLSIDLADEIECTSIVERVGTVLGPVDILVNNAGVGWYGYGEKMPWETARQMIEVNIAALTNLTLSFLGEMKERGTGHIINIGSIAGSIPSQGVALYSATKAFVDAFSTALYRELAGTPVKVSVVRAGAVATEFYDIASKGSASPRIPVAWLAIHPEAVANRTWDLIKRPTRTIYVPRILRVVPWIEINFGWLLDRLGPLLLQAQTRATEIDPSRARKNIST